MTTQPFRSISTVPPTLDHSDIAWIQQEIKRLIEYTGDTHIGYQFRTEIIPRLNRLIEMHLTKFVQRTPVINIGVLANHAEEVQSRGFIVELYLYGARSNRALPLTQLEAFFFDDAFTRRFAHDMIAHAAVVKWGR